MSGPRTLAGGEERVRTERCARLCGVPQVRPQPASPHHAHETDDEGDGEHRVGHQRSEHPSDHARFQV